MKIDVLDHGYVRLVDHLGDDLSIVNAARVSYDKESKDFSPADARLLDFLIREDHTSPLRHAALTFEVYAPLMVARQHWKYAVASTFVDDQNGWNESCLPAWQELWSYGNLRVTVQDILDEKALPLRSVNDDGVVVPNRVKNIWPSGKQEIITIIDEFGNKISCTKNHRIKTPSGWVEAGELKVNNLVGLCNEHHYLIHGKRPQVFGYGKVVSINSAGIHETYDIEMELESNFVAGGIVVHNSRRYVTENEEFYVPEHFREAPPNSKQGSGGNLGAWANMTWQTRLDAHIKNSLYFYDMALKEGLAPEQARLFLPAYGLYVRYRWTVSLAGVLHFLDQRLAHDAQVEIQAYAEAVRDLTKTVFPKTLEAWLAK